MTPSDLKRNLTLACHNPGLAPGPAVDANANDVRAANLTGGVEHYLFEEAPRGNAGAESGYLLGDVNAGRFVHMARINRDTNHEVLAAQIDDKRALMLTKPIGRMVDGQPLVFSAGILGSSAAQTMTVPVRLADSRWLIDPKAQYFIQNGLTRQKASDETTNPTNPYATVAAMKHHLSYATSSKDLNQARAQAQLVHHSVRGAAGVRGLLSHQAHIAALFGITWEFDAAIDLEQSGYRSVAWPMFRDFTQQRQLWLQFNLDGTASLPRRCELHLLYRGESVPLRRLDLLPWLGALIAMSAAKSNLGIDSLALPLKDVP